MLRCGRGGRGRGRTGGEDGEEAWEERAGEVREVEV